MTKYNGWVPTVSGRLSFSIIGDTSYPRRAVTANVADNKNRYIISYQKRYGIDGSLPFKASVSRKFFNLEGQFWCLCVCKCSNDPTDCESSLNGRIFIFHSKDSWRSSAEDLVKKRISELLDFRKHPNQSIDSYFLESFNFLLHKVTGYSSYYVDFQLSREGECEIITPQNSSNISQTAPTFPPEEIEKSHVEHIVCSQLFFFLKDITHHHQHHNPSTDTIVDIYENHNNDDFSWRSRTLRVLLKKIYQCKRDQRSSVLTTSCGTLAYAKSFRKAFEKKYPQKVLNPTFNDAELEQSIKARQDDLSFSIQKKIRNSESFRNLFLGSLGILITLSSLLKLADKKLSVEPSPVLFSLAEILIQHTVYSALCLALFIFTVMVFIGSIDILNWSIIRGLQRILQVYKSKIAATIAGFIGVMLIYIASLIIA